MKNNFKYDIGDIVYNKHSETFCIILDRQEKLIKEYEPMWAEDGENDNKPQYKVLHLTKVFDEDNSCDPELNFYQSWYNEMWFKRDTPFIMKCGSKRNK